jgi:hypothetical protein
MNPCQCRLLVLGSRKDLRAWLRREPWPDSFQEVEPLELEATRRSFQFTTTDPPVPWLRRRSRTWPTLTFVLDYDTGTAKGLALLRGGHARHRRLVYQPPP